MKARVPIRNREGQTGSAVIEIALASVVLMGMVVGMFQMFLAFYTYHYISEAAREGSRYAMVRGSTSCTNTPGLANCNATAAEVRSYVQGLGLPGIDATNAMTVTAKEMSDSAGRTGRSAQAKTAKTSAQAGSYAKLRTRRPR